MGELPSRGLETALGEQVATLKIAIAGAGIGGLAAAIALRDAGHHIEIYESSRSAQETGAAIHLQPNITGILRRYGLDPVTWGSNLIERYSFYNYKTGDLMAAAPQTMLTTAYPHPFLLSHRVDLHEALKKRATTGDAPGPPVKIHLQSKVAGCDPHAPSLTLQDGTVVKADLIVGADGIRSALRSNISGENALYPTGCSAFRFIIPTSSIKDDPVTAPLLTQTGDFQVYDGQYRRVIMYPCRNNTEQNFICFHPDAETQGPEEGWSNNASIGQLLEVYKDIHEPFKSVLAKVNPTAVKIWKLLDHAPLKTFVSGKAVLIGDAAHPFLPHQGQGGAQAIEDAVALATLLPVGTKPSQIEKRLRLWQECRKERATAIQEFSRVMGPKTGPDDTVHGRPTKDVFEFVRYKYQYDVHEDASSMLLQHFAEESGRSVLPAVYGPTEATSDESTSTTIFASFQAELAALQTLLPTKFRIFSMTGWAKLTLAAVSRGQYRSLGLYIHDVAVADGHPGLVKDSSTAATFLTILFENDPDLVVIHREHDRVPVAYADVNITMTESCNDVTLSRNGVVVLSLTLDNLSSAVEHNEVPRLGSIWTSKSGLGSEKLVPFVHSTLAGQLQSVTSDVKLEWKQPLDASLPGSAGINRFVSRLKAIKLWHAMEAGVFTSGSETNGEAGAPANSTAEIN